MFRSRFTTTTRSALGVGTVVMGALLIGLGVLSFDVGGNGADLRIAEAAPKPVALQDEQVVIVLNDGSEITGKLIRETDEFVLVGSIYGSQKIDRSRIKEIRRGANPLRDEFEERYTAACKLKSGSSLLVLADWARENGLSVESRRAMEKVIEFDPNNEKARDSLGHARLEGRWLDEKQVQKLLGEGYRRDGLDLVPGTGSPAPDPSGAGQPDAATGSGEHSDAGQLFKRAVDVVGPYSKASFAKAEGKRQRNQKKNRREFGKYRDRKHAEFRGVPWGQRHDLTSEHYLLHTNVPRDVAKVYLWIMEDLHRALSRSIAGKDQHRQKSDIFIYRTQQEFMSRTNSPRGVGGFFQPWSKQIHAYHGTFGSTGTTFAVLAHEGTHQFQALKHSNMMSLPNWLIEGMAVYFGDGSRLDPVRQKIITSLVPRDRLLHLQEKIRNDRQEDLKTLIRIPRVNGSQYSDAWSLFYFLFDGPDKDAGRKFIIRYWLTGMKRKLEYADFRDLAEKYYGGMKAMEKKWTEFTINLEPEPTGVTRRNVFESFDYKFKWTKPDDWEWVTRRLKNKALVAMTVGDTDVQVRLNLIGRSDPDATPEELIPWIQRILNFPKPEEKSKSKSKARPKPKFDRLDFYGQTVFRLTHKAPRTREIEDDPETEGGGESGAGVRQEEEKKKGKGDEEKEKVPQYKIHTYLFFHVTRIYALQCEAPEEEFDTLTAWFEEIARGLELSHENRW